MQQVTDVVQQRRGDQLGRRAVAFGEGGGLQRTCSSWLTFSPP
ncbi:MAG: hypothetical protein QM811_26615 [Pirellulales bacterium]